MTRSTALWIGKHDDEKVPLRVRLREEDILARAQTEANTGCWLWERGVQTHGYGCWPTGGNKWQLAHRVAYGIANGEIPKGFFVCHRCDTPACVNPDHLFLGSQKANMADCARKGRIRVPDQTGIKHHSAKLTDQDVLAIRADVRGHAQVGRAFGVSKSSVFALRNGITWRHVR